MAERELPNFPVPFPAHLKYSDARAAPIPGTEKPGQTGHWINTQYSNGIIGVDFHPSYPKTSVDCFEQGRLRNPDGPCLGKRKWDYSARDWEKKYTWLTYNEVAHKRDLVGSALCHLAQTHFKPSAERWTVGLWSLNRPEWQITNQACSAYDLVNTSLYETLGPGTVEYILNHANVHVVFSAASHLPELFRVAPNCPDLKVIVSMDNFEDIDLPGGGPAVGALPKATVLQAWAKEKGLLLLDMSQMEKLGEANLKAHKLPQSKALASICYTSGTTGNPKGVMLSHELLASSAIAFAYGLPVHRTEGVYLAFLPLSHIFARTVEETSLVLGNAIAYSVGDNTRLLEDFQISKPHATIAVPRVLNRIYAAIASQTIDAPGMKGALARRAFAAKLDAFHKTGERHHALWDRILMNKIKMLLGGNLEWLGTGSAPLSQKVSSFLQVGLQFPIIEGYGSTETAGNTSKMSVPDFKDAGVVGPPQISQEIKLVDVPHLKYFATDKPWPRGEIWCRGPSVSTGYYKNEKATQEAFDPEGWFKTGDVGAIDGLGRLRIIDRVKNLVKLAQGEYVAVEAVENVYATVPLAQQLFIYADSLQAHLILFVVPEPTSMAPFVSSILHKTVSPTDVNALEEALAEPKVQKAVLEVFDKEASSRKLNGFERAKQIGFRMKPFSEDEDTLTPTMKVKRNNATSILKPQADALFESYSKSGSVGAKL